MSKPESAGFIIFRRLEQNPIEYLLLQTPIGKQHWTPPKGHLEADESPLQAAERETKEEAGLEKSDFEYYDKFEETITYDCNGRPKIVVYYLGRLRNAEQSIQLSDEHHNLCWSTLEDACRIANHSETQNVIRKADEFIQKNL
ncbi:unnamed protein product [Rotaria socialis]|uniref:Bis(5'-nucleosyl)-tetraphosphatase [asymmetrical] n=1 Tax=Rotaria socialis TaxID=392032 RepID=A0A821GSP7_9BILA|nr:unnamed protein product [Rotaria socialis]CAF4673871.1 unnamed protein product [Rotaria socialis]